MKYKIEPLRFPEMLYGTLPCKELRDDAGYVGKISGALDGYSVDTLRINFRSVFLQLDDSVYHDLMENDAFANIRELLRELGSKNPATNCSPIANFCSIFPASQGFFVKTRNMLFVFQVDTKNKAFSCYCYVLSKWQIHSAAAQKGLIFDNGEIRFTLADGDMLKIITKNGHSHITTVRYIRDNTFTTDPEWGENIYTPEEFVAEFRRRGCQALIPMRRALPERSFAYFEDSGEIVVIHKGSQHSSPSGYSCEDLDPKVAVKALNDALGVTKAQAVCMVAGIENGWHSPSANPDNYDCQGELFPF